MHTRNVRGRRQEAALGAWSLTLITLALFLVSTSPRAQAIPAFARKFGLPCSACHEAWP
jgi:hypothetical protein